MKLLLAFVLLFAFLTLSCSRRNIKQSNKTWCVARQTASDGELANNINFVCANLKMNTCDQLIGNGSPCYEPNTLQNHASVVMDAYYAENSRQWWNCDFKGTGTLSVTDPSFGNCIYL